MDVAAVRARRRRAGGRGLRPGRRGDGLDGPADRLVRLLRLRAAARLVRRRPAGRSPRARTRRSPGSRPTSHALDTRLRAPRSAGWSTEAAAIGADGVVGVRLSPDHLGNAAPASSSPSAPPCAPVRRPGPRRVFSHAPAGPGRRQAACLAGWMPAELAFGISVGDPPRRLAHPPAGARGARATSRSAGVHRAGQPRPRPTPARCSPARARPAGADGAVVVVDGPAHLGDRAGGGPPRPRRRGHVFGTRDRAVPPLAPRRRPAP